MFQSKKNFLDNLKTKSNNSTNTEQRIKNLEERLDNAWELLDILQTYTLTEGNLGKTQEIINLNKRILLLEKKLMKKSG